MAIALNKMTVYFTKDDGGNLVVSVNALKHSTEDTTLQSNYTRVIDVSDLTTLSNGLSTFYDTIKARLKNQDGLQ